jgi:hypothetical protein
MKCLLATAALFLVSLAAQAQSGLVKLTHPLPYYKSLRDTASVPPADQRYPAGITLQTVRTVNSHWYAVAIIHQGDVAAYYVRAVALQAARTTSIRQLPYPN